MLNFKEVYNYSIDGVYNISQLCYNWGELTNWKIMWKSRKSHMVSHWKNDLQMVVFHSYVEIRLRASWFISQSNSHVVDDYIYIYEYTYIYIYMCVVDDCTYIILYHLISTLTPIAYKSRWILRVSWSNKSPWGTTYWSSHAPVLAWRKSVNIWGHWAMVDPIGFNIFKSDRNHWIWFSVISDIIGFKSGYFSPRLRIEENLARGDSQRFFRKWSLNSGSVEIMESWNLI